MIFDGIASSFVAENIDFFPSRAVAEADAREGAARDAPELADELYLAAVDFGIASAPNEGPAWEQVRLPSHRARSPPAFRLSRAASGPPKRAVCRHFSVGREGFEPSTLGLRVPCSTS